MSKYTDMKEFYDGELKRLRDEKDFWRDKARTRTYDLAAMDTKIETYEKLISKLLKEPTEDDELFIFKGAVYRAISRTLSCDADCPETLDVTFIKVSEGILK